MNVKELDAVIRARIPLIAVLHENEEERTISVITDIAKNQQKPVYIGSITKGITNNPDMRDPGEILSYIEETQNQGIYILVDFLQFAENPFICRKLRDIYNSLQKSTKTLIFVEFAGVEINACIRDIVYIFESPTAEKSEIKREIESARSALPELWKESIKIEESRLIDLLTGLPITVVKTTLKKGLIAKNIDETLVISEKKNILRRYGIDLLSGVSAEKIGGLNRLKSDLTGYSAAFSENAKNYGIIPPKGIILVGPPGTGKTMSAKLCAHTFGVPLIAVTSGSIHSKYYGESVQNLRRILKIAQRLSPVCLLLDEIEKTIGGEHEESQRILAELLTFLEENAGIFVIGTANGTNIPLPLIQRMAGVYFVDLPAKNERMEIWRINIAESGRDPNKYNIKEFAERTEGFSGREIKNAYQYALMRTYSEKREITDSDVIMAIGRIVPLSVSKAKELSDMREWCKKNAIFASETEKREEKGVFIEV